MTGRSSLPGRLFEQSDWVVGQRDHAERLEGIAGCGAGAQDLSWDLVFFR